MKKNLLCVIVLFIVLFSSGCTSVSNDKKDEYYAPLKDTYYFNSYEELETFLSPNQLMKEFTEDNLEFYGENFKNVVSKIVNGKLKYMIPILDEKECTLQKNESQPKIALFTCELYNEPWIWYNVTVNNVDVSIRVMLSDKLDNTKDSENASQVLKSFAPSAPNVDNKDKYSNYKNIYESKININGMNNTTLIYELNNSTNIYIICKYESTLICIYGENNKINNLMENINLVKNK